jgi:hypothetical protein
MSSYTRMYSARDKYGIVHITKAYQSGGEWYYTPWCDMRAGIARVLQIEKVDKRKVPITCFVCIPMAQLLEP